jgi:hypothetical protein
MSLVGEARLSSQHRQRSARMIALSRHVRPLTGKPAGSPTNHLSDPLRRQDPKVITSAF